MRFVSPGGDRDQFPSYKEVNFESHIPMLSHTIIRLVTLYFTPSVQKGKVRKGEDEVCVIFLVHEVNITERNNMKEEEEEVTNIDRSDDCYC